MVVPLLDALSRVLLVWLVAGPAVAGVGLIVQRCLRGGRPADWLGWLEAFWLGVAGVLLIVQGWSLLLPVNGVLLAIVLASGLVGVAAEGRWLPRLLAGVVRRPGLAIASAAAVAWMADRAIGPADIGDSGLYHFAVIRWANESAVVPGLGNLSPAFAINNSSLLLTALFNTGPLAGRGEHFVNGLLLTVMALQAVRGIANLIRQGQGDATDRTADCFDALIVGPILLYALGREASTPTTDWPAGAMLIAMAGQWLRSWRSASPRRVFALLFLGAAAVTIKLSAVVFAGGVATIVLASLPRDGSARASWRAATAGLVGALLLAGPWVTRNVIQTGYPLYPSGVLGLPVAWRVPKPMLAFLYDAITLHAKGGMQLWLSGALARTPLHAYARLITPPFDSRAGVSGLNWLPSWVFTQPLVAPVELVTPLGLAMIALLPAWRADRKRSLQLLAATLPAMAFWLLQSPDRRYIWATTWTLGGGLFALAATRADWRRRTLVGAVLLCAAVPIGYRVGLLTVLRSGNALKQIPLLPPGPDGGFYPRPTADLSAWRSRWGVTVYTDPAAPAVWSHEQPAAGWPAPDPDLRYRLEGDPAAGFVIDRSSAGER